MDVLTDSEMDALVNQSKLVKKYAATEDRESACEILTSKLEEAAQKTTQEEQAKAATKAASRKQEKEEKSTLEKVLESPVTKQIGRTAASVITRSLLGALGLGGKSSSRRKNSSSWF
jgi:hypothetical protein